MSSEPVDTEAELKAIAVAHNNVLAAQHREEDVIAERNRLIQSAHVGARRIAKVTGLSVPRVSQIRRGE